MTDVIQVFTNPAHADLARRIIEARLHDNRPALNEAFAEVLSVDVPHALGTVAELTEWVHRLIGALGVTMNVGPYNVWRGCQDAQAAGTPPHLHPVPDDAA